MHETLIAVQQQVRGFRTSLRALEPHPDQYTWGGEEHLHPGLTPLFREARNILNHAAALVGYFDGYAARSALQQRVARELMLSSSGSYAMLFPCLEQALTTLEEVLTRLITRDALTLAPGGPRKPGPERTLVLCALHLKHIEDQVHMLAKHMQARSAEA